MSQWSRLNKLFYHGSDDGILVEGNKPRETNYMVGKGYGRTRGKDSRVNAAHIPLDNSPFNSRYPK